MVAFRSHDQFAGILENRSTFELPSFAIALRKMETLYQRFIILSEFITRVTDSGGGDVVKTCQVTV